MTSDGQRTIVRKPAPVQSPLSSDQTRERQEACVPSTALPRKISNTSILAVALFSALFWLCNSVPLRGTDLWGHVLHGQWILEHGVLPRFDMICPLLAETPVTDTAWLSQVIFALADDAGGFELLSALFAAVVTSTYIVLFAAYQMRGAGTGVALACTSLAAVVGWSRLFTIRPEMFGFLAFALLLWMLASWTRTDGMQMIHTKNRRVSLMKHGVRAVGMMVLFAVWANLHGSFVIGLAVLGCVLLGNLADTAWTRRSLQAVRKAPAVIGPLAWCTAAVAGTLTNPYGINLLAYVLTFTAAPALKDLLEWQSMSFGGVAGREFILSLVVLLFVFRFSRRRIATSDVLMLLLLGYASLVGIRMIGWYAAVFGYVVARHLGPSLATLREKAPGKIKRVTATPVAQGRQIRGGRFALCLLLPWTAFALSPASSAVLGHQPRTEQQVLGRDTPIGVAEFLKRYPIDGLVFTPQHWGDWLTYATRQDAARANGLTPMMTTNVHLCPAEAWRDYRVIRNAQAEWEQTADKYGLAALIIDRRRQQPLAEAAGRSERWTQVHIDHYAVVFAANSQPGKE